MKAWAVKLPNGKYYNDRRNDVTPALYPTRLAAEMSGQGTPVRVSVELWTVSAGDRSHRGWAVQLPGRWRFARDGLNDVTPGLWPTKRAATAWWDAQGATRGTVRQVWVTIDEI